jgi:hypothetical protein
MNSVEKTLNQLCVPRLQIRCDHAPGDYFNQTWVYELVYQHFTGEIEKKTFGETARNGGKGVQPVDENGRLDLPIRDGAHIKHDAVHLNLPAYAICDDIVQLIDLEEFKSKFPDRYL